MEEVYAIVSQLAPHSATRGACAIHSTAGYHRTPLRAS